MKNVLGAAIAMGIYGGAMWFLGYMTGVTVQSANDLAARVAELRHRFVNEDVMKSDE